MCSIHHDKKAIFIHIPKNGGSYIAEILSKYYGFKNYYLQRPDHALFCKGIDKSVDKHENKIHGTLIYYKTSNYINKILNMNKDKWDSYFIFTFVRNPYSRIISGWKYCYGNTLSFEDFLKTKNINSYNYWHTFMTQTRHLINIDGKLNIHFIGHLENIENDLKIILHRLGYSIIHKSFIKNKTIHDNYKSYYNKELIDIVNNNFKYDFDNFNYPTLFMI